MRRDCGEALARLSPAKCAVGIPTFGVEGAKHGHVSA